MTDYDRYDYDDDEDLPEPDLCEEGNPYVDNPDTAIDLISELIRNENNRDVHLIQDIRRSINELFSSISGWNFENKLDFYQRYMRLCDRLVERQKVNLIHDKIVVSLGGKFSAGKSKFINDISGIHTPLPFDTVPTTSIPTYILKSDKDKITANSIWGYNQELTEEALDALSHKMDEILGTEDGRETGFAPFIESIVVESTSYNLPENIVLLDTPGYTKYDGDVYGKRAISDRQMSHDQLSKTDHLIWLVDIENGTIMDDDIKFIESLELNTPILIVLTKADLKPYSQVEEIIEQVKRTVENAPFYCFGVTAYSSDDHREYVEGMIDAYLEHCAKSKTKIFRIEEEFRRLGSEMRASIEKTQREERKNASSLFYYIKQTEKVMETRSLAELWGQSNQNAYMLSQCLRNFDRGIDGLNCCSRSNLT